MPSNFIPVFAAAILAIVVAGTLLILLGCRLTNAEMPGVLRAAWVNVTGVGAVCLVNVLTMLLLSPVLATFRESSPPARNARPFSFRCPCRFPPTS